MKKYLSMGFGVNSVALFFLLKNTGVEFETVYVNHGADYPETKSYVNMFIKKYPVTIIKPNITRPFDDDKKTWDNLLTFCEDRKIIPQQWPRWCTVDFKKDVVSKYVEKPCIMYIGIDAGESGRAKIENHGKIKYEWPLIEHGIDREQCKQIIIDNNMPVPPKSGCFICPFQKKHQWENLRRKHPMLFKKAQQLEKQSGRTFIKGKSLSTVIEEKQWFLWPEMAYPVMRT